MSKCCKFDGNKCHKCGKIGHQQKNCWSKKKGKEKEKEKKDAEQVNCGQDSVAMAQPRFFQKMHTVFQIQLPLFWKYSRVWKGPKAKGHVLVLRDWIIHSWVIHMALIWSQAMSQIKAVWITKEGIIQFLSAKTCPLAFGPFHTLEYLQNFRNFIWSTVPIFWQNISWAMATLIGQWHIWGIL